MNSRRDLNRLADMREALQDICQLTAQGREQFESDRTAQQAVAYNLAVLGEAAKHSPSNCANVTRKCPGVT